MGPDNRFQTEEIEVAASSSLAIRSSDQKIAVALSLPVIAIPVTVAPFAGRISWLGGRRGLISIRRSARACAALMPAVVAGRAGEFFPYRRGLLRQFRRCLLGLFERRARGVPAFGPPGDVPPARRFQFECQRRHPVAAATGSLADAPFFQEFGFERFEFARLDLFEGAASAIHIEALRFMPPLQLKARLGLGLVERLQLIDKVVMPAPVLMPAQLAANGIEPAHPRQNRDQTGRPALVPLQPNAAHLCFVSLFQRLPGGALMQGKIVPLGGLPRLQCRLFVFKRPAPFSLACL
jgi:hypothetical protein